MSFFQSDRLSKIRITQFAAMQLIISLVAMIIHLFATRPWGIGVTQDTVFYFSAAENFLEGNGISWTGGGGLVKPLIHFPPLYPVAVASIKVVLSDVNHAATWINAFLYGLNVFIVGVVIHAVTKSRMAGMAGALIALFSPLLLDIHLDAMSEPLYLLLVFVSLGLLTAYIKESKIQFVLIAGVSSSLAVLTRYVGISVVATGILLLLVWFPGSLKRKVREAIRYTIVAMIPVSFWYLRNYFHTGSFTNRSIGFHPITISALSEGLNSLSSWFLSDSVSQDIRIVISLLGLLGIGGVLFGIVMKRGYVTRTKTLFNTQVILVLVLHAAVYFLLLIFSVSFIDASTRLENRILSPLYILTLILAIISTAWVISNLRWRILWVRYLIGLSLVAVVAACYLPRQLKLVEDMRLQGRGFSGRSWQNSEIIVALRRHNPDGSVYSNEAFSVLYLTGIPARWIPEKYDPVKATVRDTFDEQMEKMRVNLSQPDSALAVFHQGYLKTGMPTLDEITEGLVIVHESRDGIILMTPENAPSWSFP